MLARPASISPAWWGNRAATLAATLELQIHKNSAYKETIEEWHGHRIGRWNAERVRGASTLAAAECLRGGGGDGRAGAAAQQQRGGVRRAQAAHPLKTQQPWDLGHTLT